MRVSQRDKFQVFARLSLVVAVESDEPEVVFRRKPLQVETSSVEIDILDTPGQQGTFFSLLIADRILCRCKDTSSTLLSYVLS